MDNTTFSERLKKALSAAGMRPSQLAAVTGLSKARISQYMNGIYIPKSQAACLIARALNVSETWLIGEGGSMKRSEPEHERPNISEVVPNGKVYTIPLFESVSAGFGAYAANEIVDYIPTVIKNAYDVDDMIAIRVTGDSMTPKIEDGDIIIVRKQESVDSGDISVVLLDGDEGLVKVVEYGSSWVELRSLNEEYPVRRFEGAEVQRLRVVGKVKQIIKML